MGRWVGEGKGKRGVGRGGDGERRGGEGKERGGEGRRWEDGEMGRGGGGKDCGIPQKCNVMYTVNYT